MPGRYSTTDVLDQFETTLAPQEETAFAAWKQRYAPQDSGADYDLRGAFKAGLTPDPTTGHWPDTFKKPNHPTFSVESKYAPAAPEKAGRWEGDKYIPPNGSAGRYSMADVGEPGKPGKSVAGFAGNVVTSTGDLIGNVARAVSSPRKTAGALVDLGVGTVAQMAGTAPHFPEQAATVEAFKNNIMERYGSLDAFKESAYKDPAGVLADIASLAGGVGIVARGAGAVSGLTKAADVARVAEGVASTIDPLSNVVRAGRAAAIPARGAAAELANKLYQGSLKPSTTLPISKVKELIQTGLSRGIPVSPAGLEKLQGLIDDLNDTIKQRIETSAESGATLDPSRVAKRIDEIRPTFAEQVNPDDALKSISGAKAEYLRKHTTQAPFSEVAPGTEGMLEGKLIPTGKTSSTSVVTDQPLLEAQAEKVGTYRQLRKKYGELKGAEIEAQKALARGIKEELETVMPGLKELNAKDSQLIGLEEAITKAVKRIYNRDEIPIGSTAVSIAKSVWDNPAVKSRIAMVLAKVSKNRTGTGIRIVGATPRTLSAVGQTEAYGLPE